MELSLSLPCLCHSQHCVSVHIMANSCALHSAHCTNCSTYTQQYSAPCCVFLSCPLPAWPWLPSQRQASLWPCLAHSFPHVCLLPSFSPTAAEVKQLMVGALQCSEWWIWWLWVQRGLRKAAGPRGCLQRTEWVGKRQRTGKIMQVERREISIGERGWGWCGKKWDVEKWQKF